jgi:hypothetical protein
MTVRALWGVVVALACLVSMGYVVRDRGPATERMPVLVATKLIPAGTPGHVMIARGMVVVTEAVPEVGVIPDPKLLKGGVLSHDVFAGEQVIASDLAWKVSAAPAP